MMVANAITLIRLGLFAVFLNVAVKVGIGSAWPWFALSWALDAIDGTIARGLHEESRFGFLLDKVVDRITLVGTGIFLLWSHDASPWVVLLFTKDILLLPALVIHWVQHSLIQSAGYFGKLTTFLQGGSLIWILIGWPFVAGVIAVVAAVGFWTAVLYWQQFFAVSEKLDMKKQEAV